MTTAAIRHASTEIAGLLLKSYQTERGIHAETIIGAAAALAGEFALRSTSTALPATGWIVGDNVNGILFEDEATGQATLWTIIRTAAERSGATASRLPDPIRVVTQTADALGGAPFPRLSIPDKHFPHEWSPNACPRFRDDIARIGEQNQLSSRDLPIAVGFAIALLMEKTKDILPPEIAATLALEIMVGVSRMAPLPEPISA